MAATASPAPAVLPAPISPHVGPVLSDLYQLTMCYAYWKAGRHELPSVFELFFRDAPFKGDYAVAAGLSECLSMLQAFRFTEDNLAYLRQSMGIQDEAFFEWLAGLDCSQVRLYGLAEGSLVYPREPILRIEGPLAVCQLLETPLLNLINYASLMATNASRFRALVGPTKVLLEFGLRRAQGPDGGISASRYSYLGGFDGTSNVLAGQLFGIPIRGTHAHAFVQSYAGFQDIKNPMLSRAEPADQAPVDFVALVQAWREFLGPTYLRTNSAELAAFTAYAQAFPRGFLALVDTYNTLESGVRNFSIVALALHSLGYRPVGVRLDSGDLAALSKQSRVQWQQLAELLAARRPEVQWSAEGVPEVVVGAQDAAFAQDFGWLALCTIAASDDINEGRLQQFAEAGHEIDCFGVGTHLVTCQKQPALGCVYKLVQLDGVNRIKLSENWLKTTIPGRKQVYRIFGAQGPLMDFFVFEESKSDAAEDAAVSTEDNPVPEPGKALVAYDPFNERSRLQVDAPVRVERLLQLFWAEGGLAVDRLPLLQEVRELVMQQLRETGRLAAPGAGAATRSLERGKPYPVFSSRAVAQELHQVFLRNAPIARLQ